MLGRPLRTVPSDSLFAEVSARLPLFDGLPPETVQQLSASGYGRGLLTASLRARLRKAAFRDLGHLALSSPEAIARVRKFGPVRVEQVRSFILNELARWLPGARAVHAPEATRARRLGRLRGLPASRLPLIADQVAALGPEGESCADLAARSRLDLLRTAAVTAGDVDRVVAALAQFLGAGSPGAPVPPAAPEAAAAAEVETLAAQRAALRAEQDREWDEAAPTPGRPGPRPSRAP
jgi:hypothetical protein